MPKKTDPFKSLIIKGKFNDFTDFYDENKETIYQSIIEIFREFKTSKKRNLTLYVSAKIKNLDWDTEFNFKKDETIVLKRDLLPYYEDIEDYETCIEIKNIYNYLTKQKELVTF
jgi:hypothetical protein